MGDYVNARKNADLALSLQGELKDMNTYNVIIRAFPNIPGAPLGWTNIPGAQLNPKPSWPVISCALSGWRMNVAS